MLWGHIVKVAHTHACMHMLGYLITNDIIVLKLLFLFPQISLIKNSLKKIVNFTLDQKKSQFFGLKIWYNLL
jgi:hypothetical protein